MVGRQDPFARAKVLIRKNLRIYSAGRRMEGAVSAGRSREALSAYSELMDQAFRNRERAIALLQSKISRHYRLPAKTAEGVAVSVYSCAINGLPFKKALRHAISMLARP